MKPARITSRTAVLAVSATVLALWMLINYTSITSEQNGLIRFWLGLFFSVLVLLRKKEEKPQRKLRSIKPVAISGTVLCLTGIIFGVRQFEWIGLLSLLFASLSWALPENYTRNLPLSFFFLYWIHPLPSQIFGPMEIAMQKMSVKGSELLLHAINVRVWADFMTLRTGVAVYEIPQACSGMRTATTVFLLSLGLGLMKRYRVRPCAALVAASLIQALLLNIIRISAMVIFAPEMGDLTGVNFLHDTTGIVVLAAVAFVYANILFIERRKRIRAEQAGELNPEVMKHLSEYPPFWRFVTRHKSGVTLWITFAILFSVLIFKNRPFHKAEMIKSVAEELVELRKLEDAQRAAETVRRLVPDDVEWYYSYVRILIMRGQYQKALNELALIPDKPEIRGQKTESYKLKYIENLGYQRKILEAYCLMAMKEINKAKEAIESLPESVRDGNPMVAMILAEFAFYSDKPDEVASNITCAAQWNPNLSRVRTLYPYLRAHRKWEAISTSDNMDVPHADPVQAFSACEAHMNLNEVPKAAALVTQCAEQWPGDPRLIEPLFFMAIIRGAGEWESLFTDHFMRCVKTETDPEILLSFFNKSITLGRPDLTWMLYRRMEECCPDHPALPLAAARYGPSWFLFRKRFIGMNASLGTERIDVRSYYTLAKHFSSWQPFCEWIPLGDKLSTSDTTETIKELLSSAIITFEKSLANNKLTISMQYEFARAMELSGNAEGAIDLVRKTGIKHPEMERRNTVLISEIYERQNDWQNVYETLKGYLSSFDSQENMDSSFQTTAEPDFMPILRLCRAQMNLRLGLGALNCARQARKYFPHSSQALELAAMATARYESPEEALHLLSQPRTRHLWDLDVLEADILFKTERFAEMTSFCKSALLPPIPIPSDVKQNLFLPRAELSALWRYASLPPLEKDKKRIKEIKQDIESASSPFLKKILTLWLDCYNQITENRKPKDEYNPFDPDLWLKPASDDTERATALNQLSVLLCQDGQFAEARNVAGRAVKYLPESPILWKILISLSDHDLEVVNAARKFCPDNSEIWLAELVIKTQHEPMNGKEPLPWKEETIIRKFCQSAPADKPYLDAFSPGAVTRAGEYLYRGGMEKAAAIFARNATARARGLLPAYALGLKCAVSQKDKDWALECARKAIESSLDPLPFFYKRLVALKTEEKTIATDNEMVEALKNLRRAEPDNPQWAQLLGYARFLRGDWETVEAIDEMGAAIAQGVTNKMPFIIAAEALRSMNNIDRAARILKSALEYHPDDLTILNNLAYILSRDEKRLREAENLLPRLLKDGSNNPNIIDTAAVILTSSGRTIEAEEMAKKLLIITPEKSPLWFRAHLHLANIELQRGKKEKAKEYLEAVSGISLNIPSEDILRARKLTIQVNGE